MSLILGNDNGWSEIIDNYRNRQDFPDIFCFWREELRLRQLGRSKAAPRELLCKDSAEIDFLWRSLYFSGQREQFFRILLQNIHLAFVLQWLWEAPRYVLENFLDQLTWILGYSRIDKKQLLFLAQIYQDSYKDRFRAIINSLDEESCRYIASRTGNSELRGLLKSRAQELEQSRPENHYAIKRDAYRNNLYPTIFGDKIELFMRAIDSIEAAAPEHFTETYGPRYFLARLENAEMLFRCAWLEDSLAILADIYEDYRQKDRLVKMFDDESIYRQFYRILRRLLPLYSLLYLSPACLDSAKRIYQDLFPRILPDSASLQYLAIYETVLAGFNRVLQHPQWEIIIKADPIIKERPSEAPLLLPVEAEIGLTPERWAELLLLVEQKMTSLPHEAFITMEYLRFQHLHSGGELRQELATKLMNGYLALWKWLPSPLFMNPPLLEQLGPSLPSGERAEAQRIITFLADYAQGNLNDELHLRPAYFRQKGNTTLRELLMGRFSGVQ